ncbi:MAG TPA: HK97 family phage prohead protease [Tepidisphaeraceae bacterium]
MMQKDFRFSIKSTEDAGTFTGLASTYGNVDLGGEVCERGCFTKSISDKGGEVVLLWQHDQREPIGMGQVEDTQKGLLLRGTLAIDASPVAAKAYGLAKMGVLKGLSIGYDEIKPPEVRNGIRYLKELKLWEVSLVTFPMNEKAEVASVKSFEDLDNLIEPLRVDLKMGRVLSAATIAKLTETRDQISALLDSATTDEEAAKAAELSRSFHSAFAKLQIPKGLFL